MKRIMVKCAACGWEQYVDGETAKAECINPACGEIIKVARKDEAMEARRG